MIFFNPRGRRYELREVFQMDQMNKKFIIFCALAIPLIVLTLIKVIQKSVPCPTMEQIKAAKQSNPELFDRYIHGFEYQQCR